MEKRRHQLDEREDLLEKREQAQIQQTDGRHTQESNASKSAEESAASSRLTEQQYSQHSTQSENVQSFASPDSHQLIQKLQQENEALKHKVNSMTREAHNVSELEDELDFEFEEAPKVTLYQIEWDEETKRFNRVGKSS